MYLHKEPNFKDTRNRLETEGFAVKQCEIAGDVCWLIFPPHMGVEWTVDNMIYRSGIWTDSGEPVSLSWKKFFNWDEQCELAPKPKNIEDCTLMNKEDGSTLLVSLYKGELVIRTRGTIDISTLANGHEKEFLLEKYKVFFRNFCNVSDTSNYTYVFEWETPNNKIVLDYGPEPCLVLTGVIEHYDYSYMLTEVVDDMATLYELPRPDKYKFEDFAEILSWAELTSGKEGLVVYYNNDQDIKKIKTKEYLQLHYIKSHYNMKFLINEIINSTESQEEISNRILGNCDFEITNTIKEDINVIFSKIELLTKQIKEIFNELSLDLSIKEFADIILNDIRYKKYSNILFKIYRNDEINRKMYKPHLISLIS